MMNWLQPSITRRLVLALMLALGLFWVAHYLYIRQWNNEAESGGFDARLIHLADTVADTAQAAPAGDEAALQLALSGLVRLVAVDPSVAPGARSRYTFRVWGGDGRLRVDSAPELRIHPQRPLQAAEGGEKSPGFFNAQDGGEPVRVYSRWTPQRRFHVEVMQSLAWRDSVTHQALVNPRALLPLLLGFPLLLLPVWLAIRRGLLPLRRLRLELAGRPTDELRPLAVQAEYRELQPVVDEFNATLARLRLLLQRERDFLADAAHEMRTPLAVIAAQCDQLLQADSEAGRRAAVARLQGGLNRAFRLLNQLLVLARLEADVDEDWRTLDLADTVRDSLAPWAEEARARAVALAYLGPDQCAWTGSAAAMDSVLSNLIGNALRHGRPGGKVEVSLSPGPASGLTLCVRDDGPGIPVAEQARVLERFRRGERAGEVQGSGLGLAIVAAAATRLRASLELGPGLQGRGLGVTLHWPPIETDSRHP